MGQRLSKRLAKGKTRIQRNYTEDRSHRATSGRNVHRATHATQDASGTNVLQGCSTRNIGHTADVPILRGCPRCGVLISVDGDYKYVRCVVCDSQFCFVCLQLSQSSDGQGCAVVCTVAPKQKVLHRMTDDELCAHFLQQSLFADECDDVDCNRFALQNLAIHLSELDEIHNESVNDSEREVGTLPVSSVVVETCDLRPLPGYIQLTTEPCCVTLDDTKINRAKMPCGHVIGVEGLRDLARSAIVTNRGHQILCQECEAEWEFFLVRHVLSSMLTPAELLEMAHEMRINKLAVDDVESCPNCATAYVKDADIDGNGVVCLICHEWLGKPFASCWNCLQEWKGDLWKRGMTLTVDYANLSCVEQNNRRSVCPVFQYFAVVESTKTYKHVECLVPGCKCSFCFICLKPCMNGN